VDEHPGEVPVRGFVHRTATPSGNALVLTHGASGICNTLLLVALAGGFATSGRATPPSNLRPIDATGSKVCCES
jgi:predicted alpha/beta-hydrolase family hydrolase